MQQDEFVDALIRSAKSNGYAIENSRNGRQIVFGPRNCMKAIDGRYILPLLRGMLIFVL